MKDFLSKMNPFKELAPESASFSLKPSVSAGGGVYNQLSHGSGGAKYPGGLSNYGYSRAISNRKVRQNARQAFHDSPEAKALITRFADTIVDTGLRLEATPKAELLNISPQDAEIWSKDVEARFELWSESKKVDRARLRNFYQIQRLYQISQQRDNDIFTRFSYFKEADRPNNLQISLMDPNQIRGDSITSTYGFSTGHDGIERRKSGEEVAYNIFVRDAETGKGDTVRIPKVGSKSKRRMMLHAFTPEYAGQKRGYSRLEHILQEFEDVTDFKLSAIKKAINQSQLTMYVKPSNENDASNPLEDLTGQISGPVTGDTLAQDQVDEISTGLGYERIPEAEFSVPGATGVFNLKSGEDLKTFDTKTDAEDFDKFIEAYMSYVSSSTGMPLEVLLMKFGQNYSASRATLLLFWKVVLMWREEMKTDFLDPVYEAWLSEEIASGRISAPGYQDPTLRAAWLSNKWIGAPMPNIDPLKAAKAEKENLSMGLTNLDRASREHNGSDGKTNRRKLTEEYKELPVPVWDRQNLQTEEDDEQEEQVTKKRG